MPIIREIMSRCEVTIRPDDTLFDAARILCEHHLYGAPVVAENGRVVGFITGPDLMDVLFDESARSSAVSAFMSDSIYWLGPEDSISSAASLFALYGVRRLPVMENGAIVGIVTCRDLLQYALSGDQTLNDPLVELIPAVGEFA